ncbi:MAG: ABC transporter [Chloroflexi bacterium]|nr:ABC transporter [Chloroflexota bacterium]|tara:strand:+ start:408 stop:1316 length:909 start_codon:yes stop_codon:yes gene_type:complete
MNSDIAIKVTNLKKYYPEHKAVNGISFEVGKGEIFALLGPNGAGKTTTVEILEGHRDRTSGEVSVLGYDPKLNAPEFRESIGIVLQETNLDPYLKVEEIMTQFAGFYKNPRNISELISITGLDSFRNYRYRKLSGGQKRRLDVAIGLIGDPELLFLDEPTTGFDPSARRDAWDMISELKNLGKTILLTTHYMEEAEVLADRFALMNNGFIGKIGTMDELRNSKNSTIKFDYNGNLDMIPENIREICSITNKKITIQSNMPTQTLSTLTLWALNENIDLQNLSVQAQSLEEIFLESIKESKTP